MNIKEKYEKFSNWLENQDNKKLEFLYNQNSGWRDEDNILLKNFKDSYGWYKCVSEFDKSKIDYILGDKIATLEDISNYMINYISRFEKEIEESKKDWISDFGSAEATNSDGENFEECFTEQNHSAGYAGIREYYEVKRFWENLSDEDVFSVISGEVMECYEIDLDGHRNYWLSRSKVDPLLFSYVKYFKGKDVKDLDEDLYNSNDCYEEVSYLFPPENITTLSIEEIESMCSEFSEKNTREDEKRFNEMINTIEKCFGNNPHFKSKVDIAKELIFK